MPKFLSKLQHKTYEKSEFSDEKERDLTETLVLIKDFPWDMERTLTDIQLTGPSVTIKDDNLNYVKLGLYFGGKFCVYYLDADNHLYEYHCPDIAAASKLVNDFFEGNLDLHLFEKHFFNIGNQPHFISKTFEYRIKSWRVILLIAFLVFYLGLFLGVGVSSANGNKTLLAPGAFVLVIGVFIAYILSDAFINRHLYLRISRGNNEFDFGKDDAFVTYNKLDIAQITFYDSGRGGPGINMNNNCEVRFKNGTSIVIPNMLIPRIDFIMKFPDELKIPRVYIRGGLFANLTKSTYSS